MKDRTRAFAELKLCLAQSFDSGRAPTDHLTKKETCFHTEVEYQLPVVRESGFKRQRGRSRVLSP